MKQVFSAVVDNYLYLSLPMFPSPPHKHCWSLHSVPDVCKVLKLSRECNNVPLHFVKILLLFLIFLVSLGFITGNSVITVTIACIASLNLCDVSGQRKV